jgi:hypothetical protein
MSDLRTSGAMEKKHIGLTGAKAWYEQLFAVIVERLISTVVESL